MKYIMKIIEKLFRHKEKTLKTFVNDRRDTKRYDLMLKLSYLDTISNSRVECLTKNISKNGVRFAVSKILPQGTIIDIEIEDIYSDTLKYSKAEIVWSEEFIVGESTEDTIYEVGAKLLERKLY